MNRKRLILALSICIVSVISIGFLIFFLPTNDADLTHEQVAVLGSIRSGDVKSVDDLPYPPGLIVPAVDFEGNQRKGSWLYLYYSMPKSQSKKLLIIVDKDFRLLEYRAVDKGSDPN